MLHKNYNHFNVLKKKSLKVTFICKLFVLFGKHQKYATKVIEKNHKRAYPEEN